MIPRQSLVIIVVAVIYFVSPSAGGRPVDDDQGGQGGRIKVERADGRLDIRVRGRDQKQWIELASFVMKADARPYLHPVRDATGKVRPIPGAPERRSRD